MAASQSPKQPLLMIPGPTEYHETVLAAMAQPSTSHLAPEFVESFGRCLEMSREVFLTKTGSPVIVAGSGTLGWDMVAANFLSAGDSVLVVNTGYFSESFAAACAAYGASITQVDCAAGEACTPQRLRTALSEGGKQYKLVCITQVDTSTAVLNDVAALCAVVKETQSEALISVDGVCSIGGEEFRFDAWGVDAALTCSQKALGCPPGLCVAMFSARAVAAAKSKPSAYYASLANWLPIMRAYEARQNAYFATPPVNTIRALEVALTRLLRIGMENVFQQQAAAAVAFQNSLRELGLRLVPTAAAHTSHLLSAVYLPGAAPSKSDGSPSPSAPSISAPELLVALKQRGIIAAGGLHKDIRTLYFRVGHMGVSALEPERGHLATLLAAIKDALL